MMLFQSPSDQSPTRERARPGKVGKAGVGRGHRPSDGRSGHADKPARPVRAHRPKPPKKPRAQKKSASLFDARAAESRDVWMLCIPEAARWVS